MNLSMVDYSGLKNAVANRGQANITAAHAEYEKADKLATGLKTAANAVISVAGTIKEVKDLQDKGQKATMTEELQGKAEYFNTLLENSINDGTTFVGDDGKVHFSDEVQSYMNTWLDDVNSREGISKSVKDWAAQYMTGVANAADESVLIKAAKNGAVLANEASTQTLNNALNTAISQRDFRFVQETIAALPVDNATKQSLVIQYGADYGIGATKETVYQIASTEGADAAIKYIESGNYNTGVPVTLSRDQKDSLADYARNIEKKTVSDLTNASEKNARTSRQAGMNYSDIYKASDNEELSASNRKAVKDGIAKVQAEECTNWFSQYANELDYASKERLEEIKEDLENNKGLFVEDAKSLYETYMDKIDGKIQSAVAAGEKTVTATAKAVGETYFNQWNAGKISGQYAIDSIHAYMESVGDNMGAFQACDEFINKIITQKVPAVHKESVNRFWDSFDSDWLSRIDVKKMADMDEEQRSAYQSAYLWAEGSLADIFKDCENLSPSELDAKMNKVKNTYIAKYLDANAMVTGVDQTASQNKSTQELLKSFSESSPVYYDQSRNEDVWVSDQAKKNFESVAAYYKDELNEMGFDVVEYHPVRYGNTVEAIPYFETSNGDTLCINPKTNEVHRITITKDGYEISDNPVKPSTNGVVETSAGTSSSNVTKHGKEVDQKNNEDAAKQRVASGYYGSQAQRYVTEHEVSSEMIQKLTVPQKYAYSAFLKQGMSEKEAYEKALATGGNK